MLYKFDLTEGYGYDNYAGNPISPYNAAGASYSPMQNYEPDYSVAESNPYGRNPMLDADVPLGDGMAVEPGMGAEAWKADDENIRSRYLNHLTARQRPYSYVKTDTELSQKEPKDDRVENADSRQESEDNSESDDGGKKLLLWFKPALLKYWDAPSRAGVSNSIY